jgi:L-iditol 2-dehydrogenase
MKAAVYLGPEKIEIREVEKPVCGKGEVLLKVSACAVCGTDVRIYYHGQKNVVPPRITGHEIAATIAEVGSGVKGYKEGERVTAVTSVGCGKCRFCQKGVFNLCDEPKYLGYYYDGGFAEYMKVPAEAVNGNNILKVPDKIDFPEIAVIEPLSCVINGQDYLNIQDQDTVVVFGAGPIGCMHAELAKVRGAKQVVLADISDTRLELIKNFKGIKIFNSSKKDAVKEIMELTGDAGADVIITACSAGIVQEQALQMAAKRARISFFAGLPKDNPYIKFDSNIVHYKEVSVFGAFASYRKQYEEALALIETGKIEAKKFITHQFSLDDIVKGFETTRKGEGLKTVIRIVE